MQIGNILVGYTSQERPYTVEDYPYGYTLRTSIHYWIESKAGKGDRFCSYTINPKTGRPNNPKCGTYSTFLYMYINDEGHVTYGAIDSYDREQFEGRFQFILDKIGSEFISDIQKTNLRVNHYQHVYGNAPYELAKYSEERKPLFKQWVMNKLKHIKTCKFEDITSFSEPCPEIDNPTGEVKMTVTTYQTIN